MSLVHIETTSRDISPALVPAELDTLRRTICHDLDDNEFELFATICRRTGLDPIAKQIYAVKRWDGRQKREIMQVQTGIDGFRVIAERSRNYAGPAPTFWCGDDGVWVDVWLSDKPPAAAKAGVYRKDFAEPVYAVAKTSSYMATTKDGAPMAMWRTMPEVMIAKCAESLAIRKAFPNDVSGVYTREEMAQAGGEALVTTDQVDQIDSLLPVIPEEFLPELKAWKVEQGISMKSGEFTAEMADRVIAKLEGLARLEAGAGSPAGEPRGSAPLASEPGPARPEHAGTAVVLPKSSGGERQAPPPVQPPPDVSVESAPGGEVPEHGSEATASAVDPPSGPVTLGDLLNRMEGKAAATRKGRLLKVATEVAREHTWPVPETIDDIDQRLLDAIADGLPLESRPLTDGQRKLMGAAWGKDEEGRKAAIDVASGFRGVTSTSDLTDAERDRFLTTCQEMLDEKGGR